MNPKVSVVIPTYNRAAFVGQAVQSALEQTYPNIEVILVDDGSTDNTCQVLEPYMDRIRYLYKEAEGTAAAARNAAMKVAQGEYIALLDSDDVWLPGKLKKQMDYLLNHPKAGMVSGHVYVIDAKGERLGQGVMHPEQTGPEVTLRDIVLNSPLHVSTLVIHRDVMDEDLPFDPRFRICEDWYLCLKIAARHPIGFLNEPVALLRSHEGASTFPLIDKAEIERRLDHRLTVIEEVFPLFQGDPQEIERLKVQIIAQEYVKAAMPGFAIGDNEVAAQRLIEALRLDPETWADGRLLADVVYRHAVLVGKQWGDTAVDQFLNNAFAYLPAELKENGHLKRSVLARTHIELAFLGYSRNEYHLVRKHILRGLWNNPSWLKNRGVISIFARSLFAGKRGVGMTE